MMHTIFCKENLNTAVIFSFFLFLFLFLPLLLFAQHSDNIIKYSRVGTDQQDVSVDSYPDSLDRHTLVDSLMIGEKNQGPYRIFFLSRYSGESQPNEHVFVTVQTADSVVTPLDPNLGLLKIVKDSLSNPGTIWRDMGLFYLSPGMNKIFMHHYNALFKESSYRRFVADVPDSVIQSIVVGDSIDIKQSVHLDSLKIVAEPNFSNLIDVLKADHFEDKDGDGSISPGDIITYRSNIRNSGTGIAHNVVFSDSIPPNTAYVEGSGLTSKGSIINTSPVFQADIGTIAAFETENVLISFQVVVTAKTPLIVNQGYVYSDELKVHPTDDPETTEENDETKTLHPDFTGEKDVLKRDRFRDIDGDGFISPGDLITYTVTIENSGSDTAHNVVFTDSIPKNTSYISGSASTSKGSIVETSPVLVVNIGEVAPDTSETITITFDVEVTTAVEEIVNRGFVDSDETVPHPTDDPDTPETNDETVIKLPRFRSKNDVLKEDVFQDVDGDGWLTPGDIITYHITIRNSGAGKANHVVFSDSIPAKTAYVPGSATTSKGSIVSTSPVLTVEIGTIAPNESEIVTISFQVTLTDSALQVENQGYVKSDETPPHPSDDPATEEENDKTITLVASFGGETDVLKRDYFSDANRDGEISAGDTILYTITIKNSGTGSARQVVFTDSIPKNTAYVAGSATTSKGTVVSTSPVLRVNIGTVLPKETEIITITFKVVVTNAADQIENQGQVDSDDTRPQPTDDPDTVAPNDATVTIRPGFNGTSDVIKDDHFQDVDGSGSLSPGDLITYTITIKNSGAATAYHTVFTDSLPEHTSYVNGTASTSKGSIVNTSPVLQVDIGEIAPKGIETVTIKFQVQVTDSVAEIRNQGFVSSDELIPEPTDDPDTPEDDDETITRPPSFKGATDVLKTDAFQDVDDDNTLSPGDIITYNISIQNSGNGMAHNVVFNDTIPPNTSYVNGSAFASKGTIVSTTPVLQVDIGTIAPDRSETVKITFKVELNKSVDRISNQGFVNYEENDSEPTDDPGTAEENDETNTDNSVLMTDISIYQYTKTDSVSISGIDTTKFARQGELYTIYLTVRNLSAVKAKNVVVKDILPDSVLASNPQPNPVSSSQDSIVWQFETIEAYSFQVMQFDVRVKEIMPFGLNYLINRASVSADNEAPDKVTNNSLVDTVYNFVPETPVDPPAIEATPSVIDVTDSITVQVQLPQYTKAWDLWVYLPDGQIDKTFADDFIATMSLTPEVWYTIDETYKLEHLITTDKQEDIIFEIRTRDVRNREGSARDVVTVHSGNYLVLDRNVFKAEIEDAIGIKFKLSNRRTARLDVYDLTGRHITKITEDVYQGGWNIYYWNGITENGQKIGSGVYIVTLRAGEFNSWKKFIVVR